MGELRMALDSAQIAGKKHQLTMLRFTIRDVLLLTVLVATATG